ncbi:MAG TPA: ankyrin repeat domain-containing protein [Candidatus Saccharimonadales bacterium]|nr:ankyrin repeat domain-containing protein [Candidatus Saccharimonadales bacterium]
MRSHIFNILLFSIIINANATSPSLQTDQLVQSALTTKFFDAVIGGNVEEVQQLLAQGVSKDIQNDNTRGTALIGDSALMVAIKHQKREMIQFLIEQEFDKNAKNFLEQSPLLIAAQNNDNDTIRDLCCLGTQKVDVHVTDGLQNTPLHIVADNDNYNGVFVLLKHGKAGSTKRNSFGKTPLHTACARGALNAVKSLLTYGPVKVQLAAEDKANRIPLYWALVNENYDIAEKLVKEDVLNDYNREIYYILLKRLVYEGNVKAAQKLVALDVWQEKDELLHTTAWRGHASVLQVLIDAGFKIEYKSSSGWTPLHEAVRFGQLKALQVLLAAGADKNAQTSSGLTVLHFAVWCKKIEVLKVLLDAGVDKNITDSKGYTPRDFASRCGNFQAVKLLEEYQPRAAAAASSSTSEK